MTHREAIKEALNFTDQELESYIDYAIASFSALPDNKWKKERANDILGEIINILDGTRDQRNPTSDMGPASLNDAFIDLLIERGCTEAHLLKRICAIDDRSILNITPQP